MTDYSKLKNAELESLLKERSLPHGGKKAEMVARLQEHDKSTGAAPNPSVPASGAKATSPSVPPSSSAAKGATTTASSEPAAAAVAAGGAVRADNPTTVPNQVQGEDPSKTNDLKVTQDTTTSASTALPPTDTPAAPATGNGDAESTPTPPAPLFTANLASTDVDAEIEKRKARAKKFGMSEDNDEAIKAMERARRFGTGTASEQAAGAAVKGLDEALPERRKRERARTGAAEDGDAKKQKRVGGAPAGDAGRPKGPKTEGSGVKPATTAGAKASSTPGSWMSEADKAAAEKRKNRFAVTS